MSEPTKAAMRAADKIWDEASDYDWNRRPPDVRVFETIIDSETGLPAVLFALRLAREVLADTTSMESRFMIETTIQEIDGALRKAGEHV